MLQVILGMWPGMDRKKNLIILNNKENVSPEELEAVLVLEEGVREVLVDENERMIVAETYPKETYMGGCGLI